MYDFLFLGVLILPFQYKILQINRKVSNRMKKRKFWNWVRDSDGESRTLVLSGIIAEESWFGDEITPAAFREELLAGEGDITVWINSPGGDVFAAAQIYNMLMDYKGSVTVRIDGLAASAATVIAVAGTTVEMSPVSMLMIHNPSTVAIGDSRKIEAAIRMLDEVKETILNAYELKSNLSRDELSALMDAESWMNAKKAVELGFADRILFADDKPQDMDAMLYSRRVVSTALADRIAAQTKSFLGKAEEHRVSADALMHRLECIIH